MSHHQHHHHHRSHVSGWRSSATPTTLSVGPPTNVNPPTTPADASALDDNGSGLGGGGGGGGGGIVTSYSLSNSDDDSNLAGSGLLTPTCIRTSFDDSLCLEKPTQCPLQQFLSEEEEPQQQQKQQQEKFAQPFAAAGAVIDLYPSHIVQRSFWESWWTGQPSQTASGDDDVQLKLSPQLQAPGCQNAESNIKFGACSDITTTATQALASNSPAAATASERATVREGDLADSTYIAAVLDAIVTRAAAAPEELPSVSGDVATPEGGAADADAGGESSLGDAAGSSKPLLQLLTGRRNSLDGSSLSSFASHDWLQAAVTPDSFASDDATAADTWTQVEFAENPCPLSDIWNLIHSPASHGASATAALALGAAVAEAVAAADSAPVALSAATAAVAAGAAPMSAVTAPPAAAEFEGAVTAVAATASAEQAANAAPNCSTEQPDAQSLGSLGKTDTEPANKRASPAEKSGAGTAPVHGNVGLGSPVQLHLGYVVLDSFTPTTGALPHKLLPTQNSTSGGERTQSQLQPFMPVPWVTQRDPTPQLLLTMGSDPVLTLAKFCGSGGFESPARSVLQYGGLSFGQHLGSVVQTRAAAAATLVSEVKWVLWVLWRGHSQKRLTGAEPDSAVPPGGVTDWIALSPMAVAAMTLTTPVAHSRAGSWIASSSVLAVAAVGDAVAGDVARPGRRLSWAGVGGFGPRALLVGRFCLGEQGNCL